MAPTEGLRLRGKRLAGVVAATVGIAAASAPAAHGLPSDPVVRGSVEQVQVTGANAGEAYELVNGGGKLVDADEGGELGGIVFRELEPGGGYRVREADGGFVSPPVRVLTDSSAPPDPVIYQQTLPAGGYGYLDTRDGTKLAINVHLPGPPGNGPYPTLVEYSGYGYASPAGPESGIAPVATLLGFAVVDVNIRGTGCSGGAFDYFERLQALDGYDVVETVSRQPWARDGVGMLGISYGGISQLFVAATRPPSLAAITPLSVVDNTQTTLYPGGILNTGFALEWARDRVEDALPASPTTGQPWAWQRIQAGDQICEANQELHTEAVDLIAKIRANDHYVPEVADPLSPIKFVDEIEVPVFLACQWQDEQTGGHCPALARHFTGTDRKWFTFTNGTHVDSLDPETFNRWYDFLRLYVAGQRPALTPGQKAFAPTLYAAAMGVPGVTLPADPIQQQPDYASALAAFEALPSVRVLFDNGAGAAPGLPLPAFERSFARFPAAATEARSWYLGKKGELRKVAGQNGAEQFTWDDDARSPTDFTGNTGGGPDGLWTATPEYAWTQNPAGTALSYVSSPLKSDTAVLGGGAVELWLRSSASNVDLQATVSEVRPDDNETFVQSGWLRTSARKLDAEQSTLLEPVPTFREEDATTLPQGRWVKVTIPLYYEGHVYREDSRLRVTISAPDGDQPVWAFDETQPDGTPWVAVAHSRHHPSRLVLPVVPGIDEPTGLPPCPSLRGQPCRDYVPFTNERFKDQQKSR
jgi:predicted acyl esterase